MGYTLRRPPGSQQWHCYFLDREGKRFRRSTKQTDKRRAAVVADGWYRRMADPTYQAANETTFEQAGRSVMAALKQAGKAAATLKFYDQKLQQLGRVLGADTPLARVTAVRVDEYIKTRKEEGAKAYTVSKELTALRQLLKQARRRGEFDRELSQVMPIGFATGYKPRERRLTEDEAWALIRALPPNVARYAAFVCATTARDSAVGRARGKHLSAEGIAVFDRKTKRSTRTVPLNAVTKPFALFAFDGVNEDAMVAPGISSVRHAFDRACKRLKLAHVSPNDLRRSAAHWLLERGVHRDVAAAFMGHANTKMLDLVYGRLDARELGAALDRSLGSTLDKSWTNGAEPMESVDRVDGKSAGESCAGAESNRRHADFQSAPDSGPGADKDAEPPATLDDSWILRRIRELKAEESTKGARDAWVADALSRAVTKALASDAPGTLAELRAVGEVREWE